MGRTFWDVLADSVILQGILTLGVVGCVCYLAVTGQPIPDLLVNIAGVIVGFWFGSKVTYVASQLTKR
jgi:hypothetical protein